MFNQHNLFYKINSVMKIFRNIKQYKMNIKKENKLNDKKLKYIK